MTKIALEYEQVMAEYRVQDERGIPMSVRDRYKNRLSELRQRLQEERHVTPVGKILVETGELRQEELEKGLTEQQQNSGKLLGEILLEKGYIGEDALHAALCRQTASATGYRKSSPVAP